MNNAARASSEALNEPPLTDAQMKTLEVFELQLANVSAACKAANISRQTFYRWCDECDTYKKRVEDIRESMIDMAESALRKQIEKGNTAAIIFYLKTIGKNRGYVERHDVNAKQVHSAYLDRLQKSLANQPADHHGAAWLVR